MILRRFRFILSAFVLMTLLFSAGPSFASLIVAPFRIVLGEKKRSDVMLLMNSDSKTHTYRIGWKMMKMTEGGEYVEAPLPAEDPHAVPNMVIFSPRQVKIEPNGRQSVRLSFRPPADLPPGEYRAHIAFEELPAEKSKKESSKSENKKGASLKLNFLFTVSVPVIVRTGGSAGVPTIENPATKALDEKQKPALEVDLMHTQGSNSSYGGLRVFIKEEQIGTVNNVALYPEVAKRHVTIPLDRPLSPGIPARIVYEGAGEYTGKTLAEKTFTP